MSNIAKRVTRKPKPVTPTETEAVAYGGAVTIGGESNHHLEAKIEEDCSGPLVIERAPEGATVEEEIQRLYVVWASTNRRVLEIWAKLDGISGKSGSRIEALNTKVDEAISILGAAIDEAKAVAKEAKGRIDDLSHESGRRYKLLEDRLDDSDRHASLDRKQESSKRALLWFALTLVAAVAMAESYFIWALLVKR